ncbi:lytic transglycosylase domain-containing protein [Escherichia coli]|uniref:lytic transglycosylase domain-containing protein n=1 Tax=Escherichia coli TaxID=562 RepID=UPI00183D0081|nr:lytic transglycosylase domain-containing protein [Escherichia coli]EHB0476616.1 lytic transglycosylase domain-containing protein [Escherichia coli]ELS5707703.1 lytic transglycosylase domain-containing protein [Escherichia coli]
MHILILLLILFLPRIAIGGTSCFDNAGKLYNIDPQLLRAIAIVESKMKSNAIRYNRNAKGEILTRDFGLMQINERHIKNLRKQGVIKSGNELIIYPCLNIYVGTSILAKHFSRCGVNWQCLGTYNAGFNKNNSSKRIEYAKKIFSTYKKLQNLKNAP